MNYHPIIDRMKRIAELLPTAIGGGGITPTGTKTINVTQNGTVTEDVTNYANAEVITNVPQGVFPSGTKTINITQNGTVTEDVTNYANAEVITNVPQGVFPSGTKTINVTQNGTVTEDVTNFVNAQVDVNVPNDINDSLIALGFTIVSNSIVTGTRTSGTVQDTFNDIGINSGESVMITAIDTPSKNQAIIRLTGTYGGSYRCASFLRYPNEYRGGVNADPRCYLENGKNYRVIIFKP